METSLASLGATSLSSPIDLIPSFGTVMLHGLDKWPYMVLATMGWFVLQFATHLLFYLFIKQYRKFSRAEQSSMCLRACAIYNSLMCYYSAYWCISELIRRGEWAPSLYHTSAMTFNRWSIVGYFLWDIIVSFAYNESMMYRIHAAISFWCAYVVAYPLEEHLASFMTGLFETTSWLYHLRALLMNLRAAPRLQAVLGAIFLLGYFAIRICGGTYVVFFVLPPRLFSLLHFLIFAASCLIMALQYVWGVQIGKAVYQMLSGRVPDLDKQKQPEPVKEKKM